jgi:hypothetical protein
VRRDLEADEAVAPVALVVERAKHVRGVAHVLDGQGLVDLERRLAGPGELGDGLLVVLALVDGLLEDGRVRGDAAQAVALDHPRKLAGADQAALDEVEPRTLAELLEGVEGTLFGHAGVFSACAGRRGPGTRECSSPDSKRASVGRARVAR